MNSYRSKLNIYIHTLDRPPPPRLTDLSRRISRSVLVIAIVAHPSFTPRNLSPFTLYVYDSITTSKHYITALLKYNQILFFIDRQHGKKDESKYLLTGLHVSNT